MSADLRERLRVFLEAHHPGRPPAGSEARLAWTRAWLATLYDAGLAGPAWPAEHGGLDLPFAQQVVYQEVLAKARVPVSLGALAGVAPVLLAAATPEQAERWLRPTLRADIVWAHAQAEPEAGSDLASLRTTAARDGDTYVVDGHKTWVSQAAQADQLLVLVRTGGPGLTYLAIPRDAAGVELRPLRDLTGGATSSEVLLRSVRVPVADRVGAEGEALALVDPHRSSPASALIQVARQRRLVDELISLARDRGVAGDPLVVERLVDFEIRVRVLRAGAQRVVTALSEGRDPGPVAVVSRLAVMAFEQEVHELALDLIGPYGLLEESDEQSVQWARWLNGFLMTRASTIGAGTVELLRTSIGETVLGLPADPAQVGT